MVINENYKSIVNIFTGNPDVMFNKDRDNCTEPYIYLKKELEKKNYKFISSKQIVIEDIDWIFFWNADSIKPRNLFKSIIFYYRMKKANVSTRNFLRKIKSSKKKTKTILFIQEPHTICPENWNKKLHKEIDFIFTWDRKQVDNKKYFPLDLPAYKDICKIQPKNFKDRKLLLDITSNKRLRSKDAISDFRYKTICYFSDNHSESFDLYGFGWNQNITKVLLRRFRPTGLYSKLLKSYKGQVKNKKETCENYKFLICYENTIFDSYISNKIFDAFNSKIVPIYMGCDNIEDFIPSNCFINRKDFSNDKELYNFINSMNENTWLSYLDAALDFYQSSKSDKFSEVHFSSEIIKKLIKN